MDTLRKETSPEERAEVLAALIVALTLDNYETLQSNPEANPGADLGKLAFDITLKRLANAIASTLKTIGAFPDNAAGLRFMVVGRVDFPDSKPNSGPDWFDPALYQPQFC